jgi:uncharacterized protein YgbK (DUF1537 family)
MMGRAEDGLGWGCGHLLPEDMRLRAPDAGLLKAARLSLQRQGAFMALSASARDRVPSFIRLGQSQGLSAQETARSAMQALARLGAALAGIPHVALLTGGAAAEAYLSLRGMQSLEVWPELAPGLPLARGVDSRGRGQWLLSKPGGFGQEGLLMDLARALNIGGAS